MNLVLHTRHLDRAFYMPWLGLGKPKRKIIGCNWAVPREVMLDINGFDQDYIKAGYGEDLDVDWRLRLKQGIRFLNIKHEVIAYHLYHKPNYSQEDVKCGSVMIEEKKKLGFVVCKNGIKKID